MSKTTPAAPKAPDDWEIREDMRTLVRAAEIKKDQARLKRAQAMAREEIKNLQKATEVSAATPGDKK